jgi:hypothetical protein
MRRMLMLIFIAYVLQTAYSQSPMKSELTNFESSLRENAIPSVIVLRMPDDVSTRVDVTPEDLRKGLSSTRKHKVEMNQVRTKLLIGWIEQTTFARTDRSPDLRWGLLFIGRDGSEVASIFSDRFGQVGNVNGHNVQFSGTQLIDTIHKLVGPKIR